MGHRISRAYYTERLVIGLSVRDRVVLERLANVEGEPMAVVVRRLIREAARKQGMWPTGVQRESRRAENE